MRQDLTTLDYHPRLVDAALSREREWECATPAPVAPRGKNLSAAEIAEAAVEAADDEKIKAGADMPRLDLSTALAPAAHADVRVGVDKRPHRQPLDWIGRLRARAGMGEVAAQPSSASAQSADVETPSKAAPKGPRPRLASDSPFVSFRPFARPKLLEPATAVAAGGSCADAGHVTPAKLSFSPAESETPPVAPASPSRHGGIFGSPLRWMRRLGKLRAAVPSSPFLSRLVGEEKCAKLSSNEPLTPGVISDLSPRTLAYVDLRKHTPVSLPPPRFDEMDDFARLDDTAVEPAGDQANRCDAPSTEEAAARHGDLAPAGPAELAALCALDDYANRGAAPKAKAKKKSIGAKPRATELRLDSAPPAAGAPKSARPSAKAELKPRAIKDAKPARRTSIQLADSPLAKGAPSAKALNTAGTRLVMVR